MCCLEEVKRLRFISQFRSSPPIMALSPSTNKLINMLFRVSVCVCVLVYLLVCVCCLPFMTSFLPRKPPKSFSVRCSRVSSITVPSGEEGKRPLNPSNPLIEILVSQKARTTFTSFRWPGESGERFFFFFLVIDLGTSVCDVRWKRLVLGSCSIRFNQLKLVRPDFSEQAGCHRRT